MKGENKLNNDWEEKNIYLCKVHQESPERAPTEQARSHGGKVMRMFNQKNGLIMFKLTKEDTGQIGLWYPDHEKAILATFNTRKEALSALKRHYEAILYNEQHVTHYGSVFTWQGEDCFIVTTNCPKEMWVTTQVFRIEDIH